jgi:integrase
VAGIWNPGDHWTRRTPEWDPIRAASSSVTTPNRFSTPPTATLLDEGGLTTREIADQLGHKRISMTQDVYFGRQAASPKVAAILEAIGEGAEATVSSAKLESQARHTWRT